LPYIDSLLRVREEIAGLPFVDGKLSYVGIQYTKYIGKENLYTVIVCQAPQPKHI